MNLLTRDTDYAIRALCFIAKNRKRTISVTELVFELKIPKPFLRKILQELNKEGVLISYKGKGGGFVLAGPPEKILVVDLIKIFQGPIKLQEHIFKKGCCPNIKKCILKKKLDTLEKHLISEMNRINLAALISDI